MSERVLVIGAGAMGSGIAYVAAHAGYTVDVVEPDVQQQARGQQRIA
ncbi:MAG: 3-hydroxybutyryl-CoA dehydrogenase, partial [Candidatus Eremiobacteraeota bacterium]|nr:3-hydroxybutyryl-CoA dehydrogenase [Candidatus Eremiobacteraeota bacterium]